MDIEDEKLVSALADKIKDLVDRFESCQEGLSTVDAESAIVAGLVSSKVQEAVHRMHGIDDSFLVAQHKLYDAAALAIVKKSVPELAKFLEPVPEISINSPGGES